MSSRGIAAVESVESSFDQSLHSAGVYASSSSCGGSVVAHGGVVALGGAMRMGRAEGPEFVVVENWLGGLEGAVRGAERGWSSRIAPLRRKREASPVLTRSERTMESSASVMAGWGWREDGGVERRRDSRDGRGWGKSERRL